MKKELKNFYEEFHKDSKIQKKVIHKKNFTYREIIEALNPYFSNLKGNKVLDIGCGSGAISFYLASLGYKVMGVDISQNAIGSCKINARNFGLHDNLSFDVCNFPEETLEGKFDLVLCSEVIEHIQDEKKAFQKIYNLLNDEGIALISVPSVNSPLSKLSYGKKFDFKVGHLRRYDINDLCQKLHLSNFNILEKKKTGGLIRNCLFTLGCTRLIVKAANRFSLFSDILQFLDNLALKIFSESQVIVVIKKQI